MLMFQNIESNIRYSIIHWFQPIYHLRNNRIVGYEALLRDASSSKTPPVEMFKEAEKNGYLNFFDLVSIKTALEEYEDRSACLFLNIFPSTLLEKNFLSCWDIYIPTFIPIVLELLENEPIRNWVEIKKITKELQNRGVKIAIDDMGAGYSFFQQWIELNPDYIKLDRYFSQNLSESPRKQKVIRSLLDLFSDSTEIIIEGIETEADLEIAKSLGISYGQGYLLGRPLPKEDVWPGVNLQSSASKFTSMPNVNIVRGY